MKKFLSSLIFLGFLILSQMQFVHALDMGGMSMSSGDESHTITEMRTSIFCEDSTSKDESGCTQEILPYKLLLSHDTKDILQKTAPNFSVNPLFLPVLSNPVSLSVPFFHPPDSIFQRTTYTNLIGVMKSLD